MVKSCQVNHLTVLKGMNLLVDEGIIYKKRGVGMLVCPEARERILRSRRDACRILARGTHVHCIPLGSGGSKP